MNIRAYVVAGLMVLTACKQRGDEVGPPPLLTVRTTTIKAGDASPLELRGIIEADSRLRLGFKLPGVVAAVQVKEGDYVRKGQLLARLKNTEALGHVRLAGANRAKAARDLKKAARLVEGGALPDESKDDARTALEAADANLALALDAFNHTKLVSPVNGKVVDRLASPGESVGPGAPVVVIDDAESLVAKVGVTGRDLERIEVGQRVTIQPEGETKPIPGAVMTVGSSPNAGDGLYAVSVRPTDTSLRPGSLVTIRFDEAVAGADLRIPIEAVVHRHDKDWVFVVAGNKDSAAVNIRNIELGRSEGRYVAVRSGLKAGERIVTEGAYFLLDKQPVQLNEESSP